jgi:hypothetical protein
MQSFNLPRLPTTGLSRRRRGARKNSPSSRPVTFADVKRIVMARLEPKFKDSFVALTAATSAGIQFSLSSVPQGDTDSSRSGDQINLQSLEVNFDAYLQGTGGTNDFTDTVRMIIYRWHPMSTATQPTQADILQDQTIAQSNEQSLYKWDNRKDFTILDDQRFALSGNGPSLVCYRKFINLNNVASHFTAGSTTLASQQVYLFFASDSLIATHPLVDFYARVIYLDA